MNPKSMTHTATGMPPIVAVPQTAASRIPVAVWAASEPVGIGLLVDETEAIDRLEAGVALRPRAVVEELLEAGRRGEPEMVAAGRADPERLVELLVEQHRLARRALGPQVGRVDVAPGTERRQLDRHQTSLDRATARAARAIGLSVGRLSRQATYAAPASDRAAEVRAPPMSNGRPYRARSSPSSSGSRSSRPRSRAAQRHDEAFRAGRGREAHPGRGLGQPGGEGLLETERRVPARQVRGQPVGGPADGIGRGRRGRARGRRRGRGPRAAPRGTGR